MEEYSGLVVREKLRYFENFQLIASSDDSGVTWESIDFKLGLCEKKTISIFIMNKPI